VLCWWLGKAMWNQKVACIAALGADDIADNAKAFDVFE
jgi:hypothetical protein